MYAPYPFKIMFIEGGVATFIPLFMSLIKSARAAERQSQATQPSAPPLDPLPTAQPPIDDLMQHACIDPHDPTKLYLQQPMESWPTLRRCNYSNCIAEEGQV
ncbi:unnamed protein product [Sphagnum troendelagicum]|uniref:Uncharacterized protein n=1 Tax=Sphagnum troendelagicum TaxID=128251 RepID=A0ABP0T996_9BRYO